MDGQFRQILKIFRSSWLTMSVNTTAWLWGEMWKRQCLGVESERAMRVRTGGRSRVRLGLFLQAFDLG